MYSSKIVLFVCFFCTEYVLSDLVSSVINAPNTLKRQAVANLPKYGKVQGSIGFTAWTNRTIFQFLNVPYAESPSGSKRFKAPVPIKPWNGIYNAENFGAKCPTLNDLNKIPEDEREKSDLEDCLSIAVYTTDLNASLPVMVYVHGGSFYLHNIEEYPPKYLMERDIVLVVVQFRLDVLGFLSTNTEEIPGNAGLMDTIQALRFVKENIKYFGGDPDKVTIFGQSSGAHMVSALVISPMVPQDLFHRAILQSGSVFSNRAYTTDPLTDAREIAKEAGINPNQSVASLNRAFMTMSVYDLLQAVHRYQMNTMNTGILYLGGRSLSIGGPTNLLPDTPQNIVDSGQYNKSIAIMTGVNKHDGSWVATVLYDFLNITGKLNDTNYMTYDLIKALRRISLIKDDTGSFESLASLNHFTSQQLSSGNFTECVPGIIDILGMTTYKAPVLRIAQINSRVNPLGTYLYTFDYYGQHTRFGYGASVSHYPFSGGVHHTNDLIYLFPYPSIMATLNAEDTRMSQTIVDLWTSFATNGFPTIPKHENDINPWTWQPFSGPNGAYLHIDKELRIDYDFLKEFTVSIRK